MKKILYLLLIVLMCFLPAACEGTESTNILSVGETAATDISGITIKSAEFAHYLGDMYIAPSEVTTENAEAIWEYNSGYLAPSYSSDTSYSAKIGKCYLCLTFSVSNDERGGRSVFPWENTLHINYKGNDCKIEFNLANSVILNEEAGIVEKNETDYYILSAGETVTFRTFLNLDFDPESLNDGFDLILRILNSQDEYEEFTYTIPSK